MRTIAQATAEICAKAGQGYDLYTDRAKEAMLQAMRLVIAEDIKAGMPNEDQYRNLRLIVAKTKTINGADVNLHTEFTAEIAANIWLHQEFQIYDPKLQEAFTAPPAFVIFEYTPWDKWDLINFLNLTTITDNVVCYAIRYPVMRFRKVKGDAFTVDAKIVLQGYGMTTTAWGTTTTELSNYIDNTMQERIIQAASEILAAEIKNN